MTRYSKYSRHAGADRRFGAHILYMLQGLFARLVRRNVKLQEHNGVYLLPEQMSGVRSQGKKSVDNIRAFLELAAKS